MKIVFIGAVQFSKSALEKLVDIGANIVGVCTKENSKFNSDFADLTPLCKANKIPYKYVNDINSNENIEWIKSLEPDIVFCFGWSSLIKKELLNLCPIIGYHPAQLPQNRGRHPLIWALALGLKQSASTFFFMDEGADSGDILSQQSFKISYHDTAQTLYDKVSQIALKQISKFTKQISKLYLDNLRNGGGYGDSFKNTLLAISVKQYGLASNTWRKRDKNDGLIDFRMTSYAIYNLVRALSRPYVGAEFIYKEQSFKVWKSKEVTVNLPNIEAGKVLKVDENGILVKTYDNAILLIEHECSILPRIGEYL
ncbi:formyltransferase domain-containing protein [Campylobacter iguaniorum]|uniref:Formyltransferase domain-containing protein n=1 Tax=Campylobacter iguaniorum TaxID=1244531 RepID=A0A076F7B0_9BACT|nr:formyltransferase family protein [Campylobacter iguaniorum]AII13911.1 formyltransferase domain-containing protein [Campylobacter iguaniorum]